MRSSLLLLVLLALPACGEDAPTETSESADPAWSAPHEEAPQTAESVLARVRGEVVAGRALSGTTWQQNLEALADLLWRSDEALDAVRRHMQLLQIAGDAGRAFLRDPDEEEVWRERQPEDLQIYTSFLRVSEQGPDAYRSWVEGEGQRLIRTKAERLQQQHFARPR